MATTNGTAKPALRRGQTRPNVLFIVTDQEQSWTDLPADLELPARQSLRDRGAAIRNYHVATTPCGPSRSVIYTGQHTQKTGVYLNPNTPPRPELSEDFPTIGDMLREQGYYTAYKGKWHLTNVNEGSDYSSPPDGMYPNACDKLEPYGFSDFNFNGEQVGLSWDGFRDDVQIAGDAAALLYDFARTDKTEGRPWFLAVNFVNPHDIMFYDATGEQSKTRLAPNLLAPVLPEPGTPLYKTDLGYDMPASFYKDDLSTKPELQTAVNDFGTLFYGRLPRDDVESWRRFRNYYFNCIRDVDRHIGTVLQALEATGLAQNTIVVFTSDHGERAGAHGMRQKAGTIYKEEVRVPFIVAHPDVGAGFESDALMSAVDIAPMLLSFVGLDEGEIASRYPDLKGVNTARLVESASNRTERDERGHLYNYGVPYYWGRPGSKDGPKSDPERPWERWFDLSKRRLHRGVNDGRYKFARYFAPAEHHLPQSFETLLAHNDLELYDTVADPDEIVNLAQDPEAHRDLLMALNEKTNRLIEAEVGVDNGAEFGGDISLFNTL